MTKATILKAVSLLSVIAITASFGSAAVAHDITNAGKNVSAIPKQIDVSKRNAKNLVKALLRKEYGGQNFQARTIHKDGDKWIVSIKHRLRTVATASVDRKTGNIHIRN